MPTLGGMKNRGMKVQLVLPPEEGYQPLPEHWWLPLGLLSVGTYLKEKHPETEVQILDGRYLTEKELNRKLNADIIGFGPSITSYRPALRMACRVKEKFPATVIFGGAYVTSISENVVKSRPFIDAVSVQDGEEALNGIVEHGISKSVPNLTFASKKREYIVNTERKLLNLNDAPFPNISLLGDLKRRWKKFWETYPQHRGKRVISTAAQRGCPHRAKNSGGCLFCSRTDKKYRTVDPFKYASYVKSLEQDFGINVVEDSSDDFLGSIHWLEEFAQAYKDRDLSAEYRIFGRADNITPKVIELLKRIRTQSVCIGYESGDPKMLQVCNKGFSLNRVLEATDLLYNAGMEIVGTFVLGFPGENKQSIEKTIKFAEELVSRGVTTVSFSVLTPLAPSKSWGLMMSKSSLAHKYDNTDLLDPLELQRDFVNTFCNVDFEHIFNSIERFRDLCPTFTGDFIPK